MTTLPRPEPAAARAAVPLAVLLAPGRGRSWSGPPLPRPSRPEARPDRRRPRQRPRHRPHGAVPVRLPAIEPSRRRPSSPRTGRRAKVNLGIALFNTAIPGDPRPAPALFAEVLKDDPDNATPNTTSGSSTSTGRPAGGRPALRAVTRIDPKDAHAWYSRPGNPARRAVQPPASGLETALTLNPYLNAARYAHRPARPPPRTSGRGCSPSSTQLSNRHLGGESRDQYTEFGKYSTVIGTSPGEAAGDRSGARVRPPRKLSSPVYSPARRAARRWPGGPGAVRGGGRAARLQPGRPAGRPPPRPLVPGGFTPPHSGRGTVGPAGSRPRPRTPGPPPLAGGFGAAAADFDNDGLPDVATPPAPAGVRLYRNAAGPTSGTR